MTGAEPRAPAARGRLRPVPEPDREPPHNLEAEEAVLGAVLARGRLLVEVAAVLEEADFYRPAHRAIWRAMLRLADRGQPTDPVTVLGELDDRGELADVGGGPFLHTLVQAVPTVANAGHYARLVADTARRRRVIDLGIRLAHSDADPAVLAHLAGELAESTIAAGVGERGWEPPVPIGAAGEVPAFPVEVLPGWLGEYVAAVATATQTPPDLAGMLALAVLATVAAGAVEVEPRPGWREPLCLFVAVGMDAGTRKSSVFTAITRPVAEFERQQAAAALPGITETAVLRRIADQAAATAEAAAGKAPASQQEEARAEAIARAAEASALVVPPVPRWLVDDATPEALAGLLAVYGRIALLSPEGDVFDQMAGRYNQAAGPNLGRLPQGPRRRPAQGRPPRPPTRVRGAAVSDHRPGRPARGPARAGRPARVRRPRAAGPVPVQPPARAWSAAARPAPHPSPRRWPTATPSNSKPWPPAWPSPPATTGRPCSPSTRRRGSCCSGSSASWSRGWPPAAATWPIWPGGRPSSPAPPAASPACCTWPGICATAGPARSAPTPSPAPPGWPATWSSTPGRCST